MNYFELFDLPVSILVDVEVLNKKYVALQKQFHPDYFSNATDVEQLEVLEKSSQINKALSTLKNKDETLKYVLQLHHFLQDDEKYQLPNSFLMEVMDLNEEFDNTTQDKIFQLEQEIFVEVKPIIENYHFNTITEQELNKLKEFYFKKKYLQRILDRLED